MAKTFTPPFTQTPKCTLSAIAAANTARDGSGTIVTAYTAGAEGSFVKRITFTPAQATAAAVGAKVFCVFISTDGGTTWTFLKEVAINTSTPSTTAIGISAVVNFPDGLVLDASAKIGVTQTIYAGVQDRTAVVTEGSDY